MGKRSLIQLQLMLFIGSIFTASFSMGASPIHKSVTFSDGKTHDCSEPNFLSRFDYLKQSSSPVLTKARKIESSRPYVITPLPSNISLKSLGEPEQEMDTDLADLEKILSTCPISPKAAKSWNDIAQPAAAEAFLRLLKKLKIGVPVPQSKLLSVAKLAGLSEAEAHGEINRVAGDLLKQRQAEKATCTTKNFTSKLPPPRDQGDLGWCYAFAAADLASFKLGQPVSAAAIANDNNQFLHNGWSGLLTRVLHFIYGTHAATKTGVVYETGSENLALDCAMAKGGFCLEKEVPSEVTPDEKRFASLLNVYQTLDATKTRYEKERKFWHTPVVSCEKDFLPIYQLFPHLSFDDFKDVLAKSEMDSFIPELSSRACKLRMSVNEDEFDTQHVKIPKDSNNPTQVLNTLLNSNNIASIGINVDLLRNPAATGRNKNNHAVVIAGREWNEDRGACEFIVRNSWGSGCSSKYAFYCDPKNGQLRIPTDMVAKSTGDITYVK